MLLIIGTMSFLTSDDAEIKEYTDKEELTIVHSIVSTVECLDEEEAGELAEEALTMGYDSYLIPAVYGGDIYYECENNLLPITVEDFKEDYLT
jgi:hypothetical protein